MEESEKYVYKRVKSIDFGILSPKKIKEMASAKVVTPELYDKEGYPVDGGLMDVRLGVIDPGLNCKTCCSKLKECLGHFGFIELARPLIHVKFVSQIQALLAGTCRECGLPLTQQAKIKKELENIEKLKKEVNQTVVEKYIKKIIARLKTQTTCQHCKAKQPKIKIEKPTTFYEGDKRVTPIEIRTRLEKVQD